jgi:tol-pal system protein YbgF
VPRTAPSLAARSLAALGFCSLLLAAACVSSGDIDGLHRQMNDIEKQIQALERKSSSKEEVSKLNTNVSLQTEQLLKSNADTGVRLGELTAKMEQLESKLEDTNRRLAQLSQQIAETQGDLARLRSPASSGLTPSQNTPAARPGSGEIGADTTSVRAPAGAHPSPTELYDTAYADYNKGRYPLAIQGFQEYLNAYPNTDLSDNAQYWIGECLYAQKKHKESIAAFDKLLKQWPQSDKAAAALLKKGYALIELGQKAEAVVQLQYVMHEFPAAEESRLARARLRVMGIETR